MTPFLIALLLAAGDPPAPAPSATPAPAAKPAPAPAETDEEDEDEAQTPRLTGPQTPQETAPAQPAAQSLPPAPAPMDTLAYRPTVRPFEMPAYSPVAPVPYSQPAPPATARPVTVEQYHGAYEAPKSATDQYYEQGVRSHFQAEEAMMGALDGQWTIAGQDGAPLLTVILNDPGGGGPLEGAWRDLKTGKAAGLLDAASRDRAQLTLSFHRDGSPTPVTVTLRPGPGGGWSGEILDGGTRQPVVMSRPAQPSPS